MKEAFDGSVVRREEELTRGDATGGLPLKRQLRDSLVEDARKS